jgi:hypothetical protein
MIARLLSCLLVILGLAGGAQAQVFWGTVGSNCVPVDASLKVNLASVQHAPDDIGRITLNCPVMPFSTPLSTWELSVTFRDSTGTNPSAFVRVRLYRLEIGMITPVMLGEFHSNDFNVTGSTTRSSPNFSHIFDFSVNNYWVRVDMDRSALSEIVIFHSMVLAGEPM